MNSGSMNIAQRIPFSVGSTIGAIVARVSALTISIAVSRLTSVSALRAAGVRIAVDDIGLGHSNLRMILDVQPELFTIDRYFVDGCHADPRCVAVIASVCQLARSFGAVTIAEGVEEARDVAPLVDCGVSLFQGYFFGKPVMVDAVRKA